MQVMMVMRYVTLISYAVKLIWISNLGYLVNNKQGNNIS